MSYTMHYYYLLVYDLNGKGSVTVVVYMGVVLFLFFVVVFLVRAIHLLLIKAFFCSWIDL